MKKVIGFLAAAVMAVSLLTSCATKETRPTELPKPPVVKAETYKLEIINQSKHLAVGVMCIAKLPIEKYGGKCLFKPIPVYPKLYHEQSCGDIPYKATVYLERGDYVFVLVAMDLRTGKQSKRTVQGTVTGPGQLIFKDMGSMDVGSGDGDLDV